MEISGRFYEKTATFLPLPLPFYPTACVGSLLSVALFGCTFIMVYFYWVNSIYTVYFSFPKILNTAFLCSLFSAEMPISIQGVWVLPTSFLYLSSHGFSLKMRECGHKCYACCQRSCRKHSLQKTYCVYTQAMLALNDNNRERAYSFLQKRVCVFTQAMLAVNVKINSALIAFP